MYRTATVFTFLMFLSIGMQIIASEGAEWELAKEKDGLKVFTRKSTKSTMKDAKAVLNIDASTTEIVSVIRDYGNYNKWMDRCEKVEIIKRISNDQCYLHYYTEAPWPVSDRDNVALWTLTPKGEGRYFITIEADPDYVDEIDGYVRIPYSYSTWTIEPNANGGSKVVHYNSAEAGGGMPGWMANMGVIDYPFNTLSGLVQELKRRK